ncbi:MAG: hypothetical protein OXR68_00055 [Alphaproteobacteria bacterium]|nr:hypothetical protein [Alphaproteobacteria bacterium]MDD9919003.1 hypothetical protein [Alphaproteobacteria bacterium]
MNLLNAVSKILPLINPTMLAGVLANDTQDQIVTQLIGLDNVTMILVIFVLSGYKLLKIGYEKIKQ